MATSGTSIGEADTEDGIQGGPEGTEGATSGQGVLAGERAAHRAPPGNRQKDAGGRPHEASIRNGPAKGGSDPGRPDVQSGQSGPSGQNAGNIGAGRQGGGPGNAQKAQEADDSAQRDGMGHRPGKH